MVVVTVSSEKAVVENKEITDCTYGFVSRPSVELFYKEDLTGRRLLPKSFLDISARKR